MFLSALGSSVHRLWVGGNATDLRYMTTLEHAANVVTPPQQLLAPGSRVFWRVDALEPCSHAQKCSGLDGARPRELAAWRLGEVWSFSLARGERPYSLPAPDARVLWLDVSHSVKTDQMENAGMEIAGMEIAGIEIAGCFLSTALLGAVLLRVLRRRPSSFRLMGGHNDEEEAVVL